MVSCLLVVQNLSLKMMERMRVISAQTLCQKPSVPKGEQMESLHERLLCKHATTSSIPPHLLLGENMAIRLQTNNQCQGTFELVGILLAINYWYGSTGGDGNSTQQQLT